MPISSSARRWRQVKRSARSRWSRRPDRPERAGRLSALAAPDGFPMIIRGLADGVEIDRTQNVTSVARALSTASDWEEVRRIVAEEAEFLVSNTGDTGYNVRDDDLDDADSRFLSGQTAPAASRPLRCRRPPAHRPALRADQPQWRQAERDHSWPSGRADRRSRISQAGFRRS